MHGRRIARSMWEYFKVTNVIVPETSSFQNAATFGTLLPSLSGGPKESAFSMLRLRYYLLCYAWGAATVLIIGWGKHLLHMQLVNMINCLSCFHLQKYRSSKGHFFFVGILAQWILRIIIIIL